ncbi:MAG: hypothetical protein E4H01_15335 [Lysobacterales bacterium]|nr:MAG: hypothetical protein E4H01_15335 [Xanthomonadales bacterium]
MSPMNRLIRFLSPLVAALAVVLPAASQAQEKADLTWYAVELIVFERTAENGRNAEAWPSEPGLPAIAGAIELSMNGLSPEALAGEPLIVTDSQTPSVTATTPTPIPVPVPPTGTLRAFQLVPPAEYWLTDVWNRLDKSSAYRPLLHVAWIQPGYSSDDARLVHVRNDNAALGAAGANADTAGDALPTFNEQGYAPTLSSRIRVARDGSKAALDGTLRMHRARYLHVQADLLYYRPLASDASAAAAPDTDASAALLANSSDTALIEQLMAQAEATPKLFRLTESRRMRSREVHYLDHPLFGVVVEVRPVELPETAAAAPVAAKPAAADVKKDESGTVQPVPLLPAPTTSGSGG